MYSLWKWPHLLPSASTWSYVVTKLQGGADLMLPGIVLPKDEEHEGLKGVQEGQPCSVNIVGNKYVHLVCDGIVTFACT